MERKLSEVQKRCILIGIAVLLLIFIIAFMIFYKKKYEVTFNSNGGTIVVSARISEKDKIEKPEDPTKEGYLFAGWYYDDELYDFDKPIMHNMTLEAKWTPLGEEEIAEIKLEQTELTLKTGETSQLVVNFMPENAKVQKLLWSSSDENIITVDENGNVKALKEGSATVTVKTEDEKHSATCVVTVVVSADDNNNEDNNNPNTSGTTQTKPQEETKPQEQTKPEEQTKPQQPTTPEGETNPGGQTNPGGETKPEEQKPDTPTTVPVESVSISGQQQIKVGGTITLQAIITPNNATDKNVTWSSSNPEVATIDSKTGKVTGVIDGTTTITVTTSNGKTATCQITVASYYEITLKAIHQAVTDAVSQYSLTVTRDGVSFNGWKGFTYNEKPVTEGNPTVSASKINDSITSVILTLTNGTKVTAKVIHIH